MGLLAHALPLEHSHMDLQLYPSKSADAGGSSLPRRLDDDLTGWLRMIQSEYFELPGLHLTRRQVRRLWGLDPQRCDMLLDMLEASHFLRRTVDDSYVRADISPERRRE